MAKKAPAKRDSFPTEFAEATTRIRKSAKPPAKRKPRPNKSPEEAKVAYADAIADLVKAVDLYNEVSEKTGSAFRKRLNAVTGDVETYLLDPPKPVVSAIDPIGDGGPLVLRSWIATTLKAVSLLVLGGLGGIWAAGGIDVSPGPGPEPQDDVLQQCYTADRVSQAAILREYAAKGFANDDAGRVAATEWFNNNRFRNRAVDFRPYTTAVVDNFAAGTLVKFADELEGKQ